MNEINKPAERTYWIAWTDLNEDAVQGYGWTNPNQVTTSPFPLWATIDESEWVAMLEYYGIIPDLNLI